MVSHIDADFASGLIDDFSNHALKIAVHELFAHAFSIGAYGHDAGDNKDDIVSNKDVADIAFPEVTDKQRGMMVNSVMANKVNIGPVIVYGRGNTKLPNMGTMGFSMESFRYEEGNIGDWGFDTREEAIQAARKQ